MRTLASGLLGLSMLAAPVIAQADSILVDRGLPTANLNNAAGSNRSNVAWDEGAPTPLPAFDGDRFTLPGGPGATDYVNTIRTWVVSGHTDNPGYTLGDTFSSVTLFTGTSTTPLSPTSTGLFVGAGSNATSNPNITITQVQYTGGVNYQATDGTFRDIFEVDFNNLGIVVPGGTTISFGVDGLGSGDPFWFNHASNAALSGSPQDGSDDLLTCYTVSGGIASSCGDFSSLGNGWDKASDINVQVIGTAPEPASLAILAAGLLGLGAMRRRKGR